MDELTEAFENFKKRQGDDSNIVQRIERRVADAFYHGYQSGRDGVFREARKINSLNQAHAGPPPSQGRAYQDANSYPQECEKKERLFP